MFNVNTTFNVITIIQNPMININKTSLARLSGYFRIIYISCRKAVVYDCIYMIVTHNIRKQSQIMEEINF